MDEFVLTLKTKDLTRVLKRLSKLERNVNTVELAFAKGILTLSLGGTSDDLDASGEWPRTISVTRKWLTALALHPLDEPITDLRVHDGRMWARGFNVECTILQESDKISPPKAHAKDRRALSGSLLARPKAKKP